MPRPRVFVSSTYQDLKDLRSSIETYLESIECEPVLHEKGGINYDSTRPPDESCYRTIESCDLVLFVIGGRYGSPSSADRAARKRLGRTWDSITRKEVSTALDAHIPVFTFVRSEVLAEYETWRKQTRKLKPVHVDDVQVFETLRGIFDLTHNNAVEAFDTAADLIARLKRRVSAILLDTFVDKRKHSDELIVALNSFKLFVRRTERKMSLEKLAKETGIPRATLGRLEIARRPAEDMSSVEFPSCSLEILDKIEGALECPGFLAAGEVDDQSTCYLLAYAAGKTHSFRHQPDMPEGVCETKVAVFDFDGTITRRDPESTWEKLWKLCGYPVSECDRYHRQYSEGTIDHRTWCRITCDHFKKAGLTREKVRELAAGVELLPGARETFETLAGRGVRLSIVSGSVKEVIRNVLGDLASMFDEIHANDLLFDHNGRLKEIIGTRFDFEGKAEYLREVIRRGGLDPLEVLFVGNSDNDVCASQAGVRTLCVNPRYTDPHDNLRWTHAVVRMDDLREVLPFAPGPGA